MKVYTHLTQTIRKNTKLREYLRAEQNLVRSILGYLKDKQEPAEELARKNVSLTINPATSL